jgi:hypothetical protein
VAQLGRCGGSEGSAVAQLGRCGGSEGGMVAQLRRCSGSEGGVVAQLGRCGGSVVVHQTVALKVPHSNMASRQPTADSYLGCRLSPEGRQRKNKHEGAGVHKNSIILGKFS